MNREKKKLAMFNASVSGSDWLLKMERVGEYEIVSVVGSGSFGKAVLVKDREGRKSVGRSVTLSPHSLFLSVCVCLSLRL